MLTKRVKLRLDWKDILLIVLELLTSFSVEIKRKCYQNSNIFKISWQQLKYQFGL